MNNLLAKSVMLVALSSMAVVADGSSVERGKELFNSAQLGTNGKSCASCHVNDREMKQAADYADSRLGEIVNQCIQNQLEGKVLDPSSAEMKSLIMYIKASGKAVVN